MAILQNAINANATTPLSSVQGGLGVSAPTAHGILVAEGTSAANSIVLTAGQVLVGTTSGDPVGATLTPGTGISISSVSGVITITNTESSSSSWSTVAASTTLAPGNGYFAAGSGSITFTLPAVAAVGDTYQIAAPATSNGWSIAQGTAQKIQVGNEATTSGASGSITSFDLIGDWIEIVCDVANTGFIANIKQGQVTVV